MIVILSGVTGVGKSYLKKLIIERLNFKNIIVITTRNKRYNEIDSVDKYFLTDEDFENKKKRKEISVPFEFLGNKYAYYTKDLIMEDVNGITELHYNTIDEFRKVAKNVIAIYLKPIQLDEAKEQLKLRGLPKETEEKRLREIEEQALEFENSKEIQKKFDYIIYNDYTEKTVEKIIKLIQDSLSV